MGSTHDAPHSVAPAPYRAPRFAPAEPPRPPRWLGALAVTACVAVAVAGATLRRPAPSRPPVPGDDGTFGAPVLHASQLVGEDFPCVLTRVRGGRSQVVCDAVRVASARGETRRVPRAWYVDDLTALLPASDRRGDLGDFATPRVPRRNADVIATGRRADGVWVSFHKGREGASPVELPSLGGRGALVELRYAAGVAHCYYTCTEGVSGSVSAWVARAEDGSLLALPIGAAGAPLEWRSVLGREADIRALTLDGVYYCAIAGGLTVLCGAIGPWIGLEPSAPSRAVFAAQTDLAEVALRAGVVCSRGGAGVRCQWGLGESARPLAVHAPGLEGEVAAMALGDHDLCIADARRRWWCEGGPDRDDPPARWYSNVPDSARPFTLRRVPLLDGAREVVFADATGCARWPAGEVRCWGREVRGRRVWARAAATEVAPLRGATTLDVAEEGVCATVGGRLRCVGHPTLWAGAGERPGAIPFEVPLPWPVRAVSFDSDEVCAAGEGLWCGPPGRPIPFGRVVLSQGTLRSLRSRWGTLCAMTEGGEVWCRTRYGTNPEFVRAHGLEGGEAFGVYGGAVCTVRAGRVVGCFPDDPQLTRPPRGSVLDVAAGYRERAPSALGALVDGDGSLACALGTTGRVACPVSDRFDPVPGVARARLVRGTASFGCALTEAGAVLCWGANVGGMLTAAEVARTPSLVPFVR